MPVHDPPWRQKSRPCPFFSQGRCLFADSCNFLHDVKVKSAVDQSLVDIQPVGSRVFFPPKFIFNPPSVVVNSASPRSIQLSSPTDDASRYSGLLSVLQDIIGPIDQDGQPLAPSSVHTKDDFSDTTLADFNHSSQEQPETLHPVVISASLPSAGASTLEECSESCHHQVSSIVETPRDIEQTQEVATHRNVDSRNDNQFLDACSQYVVDHDDEVEEQKLDPEEAQEASATMTILRSPSLPSRSSNTSTTSSAFSLLTRPHNLTEEPLADSGQEVTNDLLSPVDLSVGLQHFPIRGYDTPPKREDSIDSGYADSWTGPTLLARSPPHVMRDSAAFESGPFPRLSVPSLQNRRVSYDVRAVRPSPRQSIVVEEHPDDTFPTSSIIDSYESSHELEGEEEPDSPTIRLAEKVPVSSSSSPDSTVAVLPHHSHTVPEDDNGHSKAESLDLPPSPPTVRPSFIKGIPLAQEVTPVEIESYILPSSPSSEFGPFGIVFTDSRAEDVMTPSVLSSGNENVAMDSDLSSKSSLLSLGVFPSGRSSPNTSIFSVECNYTADDTSHEDVPFHLPSPPQSVLAQSPVTSSAPICTSAAKEKENSEILSTGPRERSKITPELLAHIGHVFTLSDEMSAPVDDVHILDSTGGGKGVQTTDPGATWHLSLEADVQQALHMSAVSPVAFLSDDAVFVPDEADACTLLDPDSGDYSVNLRRGDENVPSAMEDTNTSSITDDEDEALRDQSSISECWSEGPMKETASSSATLTPPAGRAIEQHNIDASLVQGKHDALIDHIHDQTPDPLDLADALSTTATVSIPSHHDFPTPLPPHESAEFMQRNRATSDVTVKPDSQSPSAPCIPVSPVVSNPAKSPHTNFDPDHSDFLQQPDCVDTLPSEFSTGASVVEPVVEMGEPQDTHATPPPESMVHSHENERSPISVKMRALPNLTIRIPSSCLDKSSSPSTAQSLPLILSLSNGHDTKRWFSSSGADSARTDVSSASAPVTSNLPLRESGSTKVPFGFRRFNPQFAAKKLLQGAQIASLSSSTARRKSGASNVWTASQQLSLNSPSNNVFASPINPQAEASTTRLKPLRLSSLLNQSPSASSSSSATSSILCDHIFYSSSPDSPSVSSSTSLSLNSLPLSSPRLSSIPEHIHNTFTPVHDSSLSSLASTHAPSPRFHSEKRASQLWSTPVQALSSSHPHSPAVSYNSSPSFQRSPRRLSALHVACDIAEEDTDECNPTISYTAALPPQPLSIAEVAAHAIAMPKPTLLFAIASDDVNQVRQVLESGEAGPNDQVGPQSALAFTLTNDQLLHKNEIVKALLAYGADPSALRNQNLNPSPEGDHKIPGSHSPPAETTPEGMDPATRYYVTVADTIHTRQTSQLIHRSFFRPLTRVRYDLIGQDWVLEQLFRVLSMHSQRLSVAPIVVLLCGPSGHGKSLLARKFGDLLDVPTHTVNMTTLRSTYNLWQSYSMSPYEEPSSDTLAQFLLNNEGKRCVVVLDEIEKVEDPKALYSLLMPWELGRCSLEAGKQHVDVRSVIWLGTSNIGHSLVLEYCDSRPDPSKPITREEYRQLMDLARPHVSQSLGASLLSRVTAVLPFLPFNTEEKMAIAAEAVYSLAGNAAKTLSPRDVEEIVMKVLPSYFPSEGARSLHRAVSNQLVDLV